jgi:hypothetical protein
MARIRSERETTITVSEAKAEAEIYSSSPRFHRHMEKRGIDPYKIEPARLGADESERSRSYRIPKDWLRIRPPRRVSDAERARLTAQGFGRNRSRGG